MSSSALAIAGIDGGARHLTDALAFFRSVPFSRAPPLSYGWADRQVLGGIMTEFVGAVRSSAAALALAIDAGRCLAIGAVKKGFCS
jgi:hypothetical protein